MSLVYEILAVIWTETQTTYRDSGHFSVVLNMYMQLRKVQERDQKPDHRYLHEMV